MVPNETKQDMSMDDILASIRRYVSDGQSSPKDESVPAKKDAAPVIELTDEVFPADLAAFKQAEFTEMKKDNNFDNAIVVNQGMQQTAQPDYLYRQQPVGDVQAAAPAYRGFDNNPMFAGSVSAPAAGIASPVAPNPFERLQSEVKASGTEISAQFNLSANDLLNQMATPLVKSWLDQNLRKIVEEIVEREVQKIRSGL